MTKALENATIFFSIFVFSAHKCARFYDANQTDQVGAYEYILSDWRSKKRSIAVETTRMVLELPHVEKSFRSVLADGRSKNVP